MCLISIKKQLHIPDLVDNQMVVEVVHNHRNQVNRWLQFVVGHPMVLMTLPLILVVAVVYMDVVVVVHMVNHHILYMDHQNLVVVLHQMVVHFYNKKNYIIINYYYN